MLWFFSYSTDSDGVDDGEEEEGDSSLGRIHVAASHGDIRQMVKAAQKDPTLLEQQNDDGMITFCFILSIHSDA